MASGKSLQLRNIVRPVGTFLHRTERKWGPLGFNTISDPFRNPERAERKARQLAIRRAAKARRQTQARHQENR